MWKALKKRTVTMMTAKMWDDLVSLAKIDACSVGQIIRKAATEYINARK